MKPRLIIFDLDGTLVHFPFEYLYSTTERVIDELSIPPVPRAELEVAFSEFNYFNVFPEIHRENISSRFSELLNWKHYPQVVPFDDTLPTLEKLNTEGFTLALATSRTTPEENLPDQLNHTGFLDHLSFMTSRGEDQSSHWTDKTLLISKTCTELGVEPHQAMMVGDIPSDISSAKRAGLGASVALSTGGIQSSVLLAEQPDQLFHSLEEFLEFILAL